MNEMTRLERFRSEVPGPSPAGLLEQEERLLAAIAAEPAAAPRRARRLRLGLAAGLAAAVAVAGSVVVVAGQDAPEVPQVIHTMPVKAEKVLTRAAEHVGRLPELQPRPGQFLVVESQTMNTAEGGDADGPYRYLYRTKRKVWMPVEGDATGGVIEGENLTPRPYPGWPIPPVAHEPVGPYPPERLADFDHTAEYLRTDFAYLSRLPTDPPKMYQHLYTGLGHGAQDDNEAWVRVGSMLMESYPPAAQRAALFRAAAAIPGVVTVGKAVDAAGRKGVAAARNNPALGIREEYIFDRTTYRYLGRRSVVIDAEAAMAPVGSVLTSEAQLKVSVADHAPPVPKD